MQTSKIGQSEHDRVIILLTTTFRNFTTFQTKEYGNCWTLDTDTFVSVAPGHREGNHRPNI